MKNPGPVPNFYQTEDWLMRGGQPSAEGLKELKDKNVKTIVNLRWKGQAIEWEKKIVTELGIDFIHIPLNYWTLPTASHFDQFLSYVDDAQNRPLFVHCYHGADRTGLFIALYRIARCGWTIDRAYDEMVACGFHRFRTRHFKWALKLLAAYARQRHATYCKLAPE